MAIRGHEHVGDEDAPCGRCGWFREGHVSNIAEQPQGRLFNPDRFSPVTLAAYLRLPKSSSRQFSIATCLGKSLAPDGTFRKLLPKERYIAVVIQRAQRKTILRVADVTPNHWHKLITRWQECGLAHRCNRDNTCLFLYPDEPTCPYCTADLARVSHTRHGLDVTDDRDSTVTPSGLQSHGRGTPESRTEHESGDDYGMGRGIRTPGSRNRDLKGSDAFEEPAVGGNIAGGARAENGEEPPCWHRTSLDGERVCYSCRRLRASKPVEQLVSQIGLSLEEERLGEA